jgi:SEC-C motif-containing protein
MNIKTPKELMQSRYKAFVMRDWEYLAKTSVYQSVDELKDTPMINWTRLEVIKAYDDIVEFKAYYMFNNKEECMHERSKFIKEDGMWKYLDGVML